jgi:SAM-dependent methyltransferase
MGEIETTGADRASPETSHAGHPFARVDEQPDPRAWIAVLDRLRGDPLYAGYKRRVAELLDAQPGERYLEVGVGTGADALDLAARFQVKVVGTDVSKVMVDEARRRGLVDAVLADAHALPFPSGAFDGAWADRTFQHLADPPTALKELARTVRPGGRIVVADPDYGTQVVNIPDQELARRVLVFRAGVGNWMLAHQMPRLFAEAGLRDIECEAVPIVVRDHTALDDALGLRGWAGLALKEGLIAGDDASAWERMLDESIAGGWFLYAFAIFITRGTTPSR